MNDLPASGAGYASAAYAAAMAGIGRTLPLGDTGGFLIERPIPGTNLTDLMGPYPLFCCNNWDGLQAAVAGLGPDQVSLTLVTEPFCPLSPQQLAAIFPLCRPLHDHYIIDLEAPPAPSRHHRRKLRGAGEVRLAAGPANATALTDWVRLYANLVARRQITDLRRFDADSFRHQFAVPGAHLVTALDGDDILGADLYYLDRGIAYAHLSAYAEQGYARSVSYPMMAHAINYFKGLARWIDLGGAPVADAGSQGGGIAQFKSGWTALTRPSHLCGIVLDPAAYAALCPPDLQTAYFPAYRAGGF